MPEGQQISRNLEARFLQLHGQVHVRRERRVSVDVTPEDLPAVFDYLVKEARCTQLLTITGLDLGPTLAAVYHLATERGTVVNLSVAVPRERPVLRTVTATFPSADAYEREIVDLLGFEIKGLAQGDRYPLPDGWPAGEFPLRKDWKPESLAPPRQKGEGK